MALKDFALTTLATVKTELGIADASQDDLLERLIHVASDQIRSYCNRSFHYQADIEEDQPGHGMNILQVDVTPIVSIDSIAFDGANLDAEDYEIHDADAGQIYRRSAWAWTARTASNIMSDRIPDTEEKQYTVTYNAGYVTPEQESLPGTPRTLPYDLEDACIQLVTGRYQGQARDPSIKSEKLLSGSVTYQALKAGEMPGSVATILDKYRRIALA